MSKDGLLDAVAPRLLVVDDDANFRTFCQWTLRVAGLLCAGVDSGREALRQVAETPYDLFLLDIELPDLRGDQLLPRLRASAASPYAKTLVFSGGASCDEMAGLLALGADDYLAKPFSPAQLLARVKALLRLKEAQTRSDRLQRQLENANRELEARVRERTRELMEAHAQLVQAQKLESIGQLAAGIAHEINTPIQYIGDNTCFLRDAFQSLQQILALHGELSAVGADAGRIQEKLAEADALAAALELSYLHEEIPRAVEQTLQGVAHVAHIVRAIKEFSHPGIEEKTPLDLNHAIENVIAIARNEWKYVAEVVTDLDASLPPVPCLPGELNQVLLNLLINAAQAIEEQRTDDRQPKGILTLRTHRLDGFAEIRVSDSGCGIPESIHSRIFDPFFTTKPVGKGTGQGLAIAHAVVTKKHGGTIAFETEVGKGTTFLIRLPLEERQALSSGRSEQ